MQTQVGNTIGAIALVQCNSCCTKRIGLQSCLFKSLTWDTGVQTVDLYTLSIALTQSSTDAPEAIASSSACLSALYFLRIRHACQTAKTTHYPQNMTILSLDYDRLSVTLLYLVLFRMCMMLQTQAVLWNQPKRILDIGDNWH